MGRAAQSIEKRILWELKEQSGQISREEKKISWAKRDEQKFSPVLKAFALPDFPLEIFFFSRTSVLGRSEDAKKGGKRKLFYSIGFTYNENFT